MFVRQNTVGDNKKGGRGFTYSCHRVSICSRISGHIWRSGRGHILNPRGISLHRNRLVCNHVSGRRTILDHCESITQDISKLCHHDQQTEIAPICSNKKRSVWPTIPHATVLQDVVKEYWGIWVPDQTMQPMCGKQDKKRQTDDGSMPRGWLKGLTWQQLWNHQFCRIYIKHLFRTHSSHGRGTWLFWNGTLLH